MKSLRLILCCIALLAFQETCRAQTYCSSSAQSATYRWINQVYFQPQGTGQGFSMASGTGGPGYQSFLSTKGKAKAGESIYMALYPGFTYLTYNFYWIVWIDYNKNGSFSDSGEQVGFVNGLGAVGFLTTIPPWATLGTTRMRVSMGLNEFPTACGSVQHGQVEDYSLEILQGGVVATPPPTWTPSTPPTATVAPTSTPTVAPSPTATAAATPTGNAMASSIPVYVSNSNKAMTYVYNKVTKQLVKVSETLIPTPSPRTTLGDATGITESTWRKDGLSDVVVYNGFRSTVLNTFKGNTVNWSPTAYTAAGLGGWYKWHGRVLARGSTIFATDTGPDWSIAPPTDGALRGFDLKDGSSNNWFTGKAFGFARLGADGNLYAIETQTTGSNRYLKINPSTMTEISSYSPVFQTNVISATRDGRVVLAGPRSGGVHLQVLPLGANGSDGWINAQAVGLGNVADIDVSEDNLVLLTTDVGTIYIGQISGNGVIDGRVTSVGSGMTFASFGRLSSTRSYCDSTALSSAYERIGKTSLFTSGTVDVGVEQALRSYSKAGREDFSRFPLGKVKLGSRVALKVTPEFSAGAYNEAYTVYIDWNGDGDFADVGEMVLNSQTSTSTNYTGTFIVPADGGPRTVRMRVIQHYTNSDLGPCNNATTGYATYYGEVEDYSVDLEN